MNTQKIFTTALMAFLLSSGSATLQADITDINVDDAFAYNTRKTIGVDIQINTPSDDLTGLSFYSKGVDGLRLLDNQIIASTGHYQGKLVIPAYIRTIVVKSRWLDSFQEQEITISNRQIAAVFDHF